MMIRRCHGFRVLLPKLSEYTRQQYVNATRNAETKRADSRLSRFAGIAVFSTIVDFLAYDQEALSLYTILCN